METNLIKCFLKSCKIFITVLLLFNDDEVNDDAENYDLKGLGNVAQSLSQGMIAFQSHIDTRALQCVPL